MEANEALGCWQLWLGRGKGKREKIRQRVVVLLLGSQYSVCLGGVSQRSRMCSMTMMINVATHTQVQVCEVLLIIKRNLLIGFLILKQCYPSPGT